MSGNRTWTLEVWCSDEPAWQKSADEYDAAISCSDPFENEYPTFEMAIDDLDRIEANTFAVEVFLRGPDKFLRRYRRTTDGDLVAVQ